MEAALPQPEAPTGRLHLAIDLHPTPKVTVEYELAECPTCNSEVKITKETLARCTAFEVQCTGCKTWLRGVPE